MSIIGAQDVAPESRRGRSVLVAALRHLLFAWGPALPIILVSISLLVIPCLILIRGSFADATGSGFTLSNWSDVLSSRSARQAILNSILLAATVASIATIVGTPLTWLIAKMGRTSRIFNLGLLTVAQNFSGIGLAFGFMATLGAYGMITLAMRSLGLDFAPPPPSSFWGFVIAYEYSFVPMFVLLTLPAVALIREDWWEACQCCGASRRQFWQYVGLPVLLPYIGAGWILIFTSSLSLYGLPIALSSEGRPAYSLITLDMSRTMLGSLFGNNRMPVMASLLMIFAFVSLLFYRILLKRGARWL